MTPERAVARLIQYRHQLNRLAGEGVRWAHSQDLARLSGASAAQVRRDLMGVGYTGTPIRGYDVLLLARALTKFLDVPEGHEVALVGLGQLGGAILSYFDRRSDFRVVVGFDRDARKVSRTWLGCECLPIARLEPTVRARKIRLAILAVPSSAAQDVAERLVKAGIRGMMNFAPVRLRLPDAVFVENVDITTVLEKVAFFARSDRTGGGAARRVKNSPRTGKSSV